MKSQATVAATRGRLRPALQSLFLLVLVPLIVAAGKWPGSPPDCWTQPRNYHGPAEGYDWRARVFVDTVPRNGPIEGGTVSPNHGYAFRQDTDDASATITVDAEKDHLLRIRIEGTIGISDVRWINEKLLFLRPWWGRIAATDLILDVETERFIYEESVTYGGIAFSQYKESCPIHGCECIQKAPGN
jgi:hypothetical protein